MAAIDFKVRNIKSPDGVQATVAEVSGSIDATTINQFQTVMDKLVEKGIKNLLLDATNVKYINSTGLGTLLKYVDTFGGMGGNLIFIRVPSKVMLVMEMLGFNALFNIYEDENEAMKYLGAQPGAQAAVEESPEPTVPEPAAPAAPTAPEPAAPTVPEPVAAPPSVPQAPTAPEAPAAATFPLEAACSRCGQVLKMSGAGAFRCPRCGQLAEVAESGEASFPESKMPAPAELSLPASPSLSSVVAAVGGALARTIGINGDSAAAVENGLSALFEKVSRDSYGQDATGSLNILVLPREEGLRVEVVDSGTGAGDAEALKQELGLSELEMSDHPVKGTVYTVLFSK